jgi:hypothetical protein
MINCSGLRCAFLNRNTLCPTTVQVSVDGAYPKFTTFDIQDLFLFITVYEPLQGFRIREINYHDDIAARKQRLNAVVDYNAKFCDNRCPHGDIVGLLYVVGYWKHPRVGYYVQKCEEAVVVPE